jgi:hypothetical protein
VVHVLKTGEQLWQEIESLLTRLADFTIARREYSPLPKQGRFCRRPQSMIRSFFRWLLFSPLPTNFLAHQN